MMQPESLLLEGKGGLGLAADGWGDSSKAPILLSHGGGQTRHSWQGTAAQLAENGWYVVNYDHRGHGDSDWSPDGSYSMMDFALDQEQVAAQFATPPIAVGASLGGLSALLAQGNSDRQLYRAIILVDITPQMNEEGALEVLEFMESTARDGFSTLDEAADVISRYTGREKRVSPKGLGKNLRLDEDGRYRWHWDPSIVGLRDDVTGDPEQLVAATKSITVPIMLVRGRESNVVTEETARAFLELVPSARYVDVKDARHMVVGDRNEVFTAAVLEFLATL